MCIFPLRNIGLIQSGVGQCALYLIDASDLMTFLCRVTEAGQQND